MHILYVRGGKGVKAAQVSVQKVFHISIHIHIRVTLEKKKKSLKDFTIITFKMIIPTFLITMVFLR